MTNAQTERPSRINLLTVCTEAYPVHYAEILIRRVQSLSRYEITPYCLTDRPDEVRSFATPLPQALPVSGWWNKVLLFAPDLLEGWNLYVDLDIVITQNFDDEIQWTIEQLQQRPELDIACVGDAIHWMGVRFNSSWMIFQSNKMQAVYREFEQNHAELANRPGGDQVWVGPQLKDVLYVDETFPMLKRSLKFHIAQRQGNTFTFPAAIDPRIKMIDCSGKPKPHELPMLPYINTHWQMPSGTPNASRQTPQTR